MVQPSYYPFWHFHPSPSEFLLVLFIRLRSCCRGCGATLLLLIGYEPDLINAHFPDLIYDVDNVAVADAHATLDVDDLILLVLNLLEHRIYFVRQLLARDSLLAKVVLAIVGHGDN